jgi:hypothetical protein
MFTNRLSSLSGSQIQRGMSHTRSARLLLVSIITLFAVITPQTAFASAQPWKDSFHDEGSFTVDCGSFVARGDWTVNMRVTAYFDAAGNQTKTINHIDWNNVYTNLNTGLTVKDPATFVQIANIDGYMTAGETWRLIVPGHGIVVQEVGYISFDNDHNVTFVGGPHEVTFGDWQTLICGALS